MKKIIILTLQSFIMLPIMGQTNDYTMQVTLQDGTVLTIPTNEIKQIDYQQVSSTPTDNLALLEKMTGKWQFVASNNGTMGADGIYTSGTDYVHFTATMPPADSDNYGHYLYCHTDELYTRTGKKYPADWIMKIEQDGDKIRIGWVLDADQPASSLEFNEPANHYLENGSFYWGKEDGGHRYIYLLSENISTQRLEGMTLWSNWGDKQQTSFSFPQNQQIYGVVSSTIPCSSTIGYFEIWASPRFIKE